MSRNVISFQELKSLDLSVPHPRIELVGVKPLPGAQASFRLVPHHLFNGVDLILDISQEGIKRIKPTVHLKSSKGDDPTAVEFDDFLSYDLIFKNHEYAKEAYYPKMPWIRSWYPNYARTTAVKLFVATQIIMADFVLSIGCVDPEEEMVFELDLLGEKLTGKLAPSPERSALLHVMEEEPDADVA